MVITTGYTPIISDFAAYLQSANLAADTPQSEKILEQALATCQLDGAKSLTAYCEAKPVGLNFVWLSRIGTLYYFGFFFILAILGLVEKPKPRPESITKSVLGEKPVAASAD